MEPKRIVILLAVSLLWISLFLPWWTVFFGVGAPNESSMDFYPFWAILRDFQGRSVFSLEFGLLWLGFIGEISVGRTISAFAFWIIFYVLGTISGTIAFLKKKRRWLLATIPLTVSSIVAFFLGMNFLAAHYYISSGYAQYSYGLYLSIISIDSNSISANYLKRGQGSNGSSYSINK